jgi:hypothetical protein
MTTTDPADPFAAPTARLEDHSQRTSHLLAEARVAPAGAALQWIGTGWAMFREIPGVWIGILALYFLIMVGVSMVPIIGMLNAALSHVLAAGVLLACEAQRSGSTPTVALLFGGFRRNTGNLVLIGVLYTVGLVAMAIVLAAGGVVAMVPLLAMGADQSAVTPATIGLVLLVGLGGLLLYLPLGLSVWWSPALVFLHDLSPFEAMKRSLFACVRNWRALLVFAVLALFMCLVAIIPFGLGLLIAGPVLAISWWAGYRDLFVE